MVTLYTKPDCADCVFMKQYLTHKKVGYTEADIFSEEAQQKIKPTGFMTAPLIQINDTIMQAARSHIARVSEELRTHGYID